MNGIQLRLGKISRLALFLMLLLFLGLLAGCSLIASPPALFPEYNERKLIGPGRYGLVHWSPDGTELVYRDNDTTSLVVLNINTGRKKTLVEQTGGGYFEWTSDGVITYMTYSPYSPDDIPLNYDLHRIDIETKQDTVIAHSLPRVQDFHWLKNGQELLIVMGVKSEKSLVTNVYRMEFPTGSQDLLISSEELGYEYITRIALSPDKSTLAIVGHGQEAGRSSKLTTYNLFDKVIVNEIFIADVFPLERLTYPEPYLADNDNFNWVSGNRWILDSINAPDGECYNNALVLIDTNNSNQSYCIPSVSGPVANPIISPQLDMMAYITAGGPSNFYIMISDPPIHFDLPGQR